MDYYYRDCRWNSQIQQWEELASHRGIYITWWCQAKLGVERADHDRDDANICVLEKF